MMIHVKAKENPKQDAHRVFAFFDRFLTDLFLCIIFGLTFLFPT